MLTRTPVPSATPKAAPSGRGLATVALRRNRTLRRLFTLAVGVGALSGATGSATAGDLGRWPTTAAATQPVVLYGQTPQPAVYHRPAYPTYGSGYGASPTRPQVIQTGIVQTGGFSFRTSRRTTTRRTAPARTQLTAADMQATIDLVDTAIDRSRKRYLTVGTHTPWQIFHGTLALREKFLVRLGDDLVPALDWISSGVTHDNLPLVERVNGGGRMHAFTVPYAFEGHANQFLAILSLSGLPRDHRFYMPDGTFVTMDDMVRGAQLELNGDGELTWTLWFLSHYVEPDAEWMTAKGEPWSMERLVQIESRKTVEDAPCGGTHRLFALALARNAYLAKYGRLSGAWIEADQRVARYVAATRQMQNADGTFSEKWYKARGLSPELDRRLKTTGHQLEWLMAAVPQSDLAADWIQSAVRATSQDVIRSAETSAECGALYHALDALVLYRQRLAAQFPVEKPKPIETPSDQPLQQAAEEPAAKTVMAEPGAEGWSTSDGSLPSIDEVAPAAVPEQAVRPSAGPIAAESVERQSIELAPVVERKPHSQPAPAGPPPMIAGQVVADVAPQQTTLPAEVDDEAAPKIIPQPVLAAEQTDPIESTDAEPIAGPDDGIDQSVIRSVSQPSLAEPVASDESETDASDSQTDASGDGDRNAPEETAVDSKSAPGADAAMASPKTAEPEAPGVPAEARRAEILEASFRYSNLTEGGRLIVE